MAVGDAARWNYRYETTPDDWFQSPRSFLTENLTHLPSRGLALDLAMGTGQNAALLVKHGLRVIGVDISNVAVARARSLTPDIMAIVGDLEHFHIRPQYFDVVLNLYYLQRSLFPLYSRILKPGGLLIFETLTEAMLQDKREIEPYHLLSPGELHRTFSNWEILVYREGWIQSDHGHRKAVASMVARRPDGFDRDEVQDEPSTK